MANQQTSKKNTSEDKNSSRQVNIGRTSGSQNPEIEKIGSQRDISNIDRQEGNLNHGECGAGMHCEDDKS